MRRRRILLLGVAALLSLSAVLAIAILLVGRLGSVEGRILGTTALLGGYGLVALPGVVLLDQGRRRRLAHANAALAALAAGLALGAIWSASDSETLGRCVGTATVAAIAAAQASALAARRRERDPRSVVRLFAASCATAAVAVAAGTALLWAPPDSSIYPRLFGALVVLDLLLAALQPVLARARAVEPEHRFAVVLTTGETLTVEVVGGDLATAAARAIRSVEHDGARIVRLDVREPAGRTGT